MSAPELLTRSVSALRALAGHTIDGRRLADLARDVGASPSTLLRTLTALETLGWVERVQARQDHWRLGPQPVQIALAHQAELTRAEAALASVRNRYSRVPS